MPCLADGLAAIGTQTAGAWIADLEGEVHQRFAAEMGLGEGGCAFSVNEVAGVYPAYL